MKLGKPTTTIYDGFMPADYSQAHEVPADERDRLRIVYTGAVCAGRDPTPLWRAPRFMGRAAADIRIEFCGSLGAAILAGAACHGVSENVRLRDTLPHGEVVRWQC